uniref:Zinc finger SWIM-type containing 1 n=1 Tax=Meleagris gallopavo TaxID=9103 RepID=A0A803XUD0_MELGA
AHIRVSRAHSHQSSSPACFQQLSRHRCAQFWERRCRSDPAAHIPFLIQQVPTAKRPGWVALPALCSTAAPLSPGKTKRCPHFAANPSAFQRTKLYAFRPWNLGQILLSPLLPPPPGARSEPAFPGAEVRLSAFHVCKHLQEQIQRLGLERRAEQLLLSTLHGTMCRATESKRREMHRVLSETVPPDLLPRLHAHWLLTNKIWATHGDRSCKKSSDYFMELETVTQGLSQVFSAELFLETCIASFAKYYQKCVSESPPSNTVCSAGDSDEGMNQRAEERIVQSLSDICTEFAARLCLSELAVVQKSVQLIGTSTDAVNVQILEDAHKVTQEGLCHCTCHFNQTFQLPCRHIQAVLNSERKTLQPEMLGRQWQKGRDVIIKSVRGSADHLLEDLESPWDESRDKFLAVSSLTEEISQLLTCCSTEEFELRCSTLRALADSWIGPYMQVKL